MATKLSNTIQLSKNTLLGTTEMFSVSYDVNYHEDSEKAVVIAESIQLFCNQTNRNIIEDDVLKSDFLRMFCRHDAENVNWWEKLRVLLFKQQQMLNNAGRNIIPISDISYGDAVMQENERLSERVNEYFEMQNDQGPY